MQNVTEKFLFELDRDDVWDLIHTFRRKFTHDETLDHCAMHGNTVSECYDIFMTNYSRMFAQYEMYCNAIGDSGQVVDTIRSIKKGIEERL